MDEYKKKITTLLAVFRVEKTKNRKSNRTDSGKFLQLKKISSVTDRTTMNFFIYYFYEKHVSIYTCTHVHKKTYSFSCLANSSSKIQSNSLPFCYANVYALLNKLLLLLVSNYTVYTLKLNNSIHLDSIFNILYKILCLCS